MIDLTGRAGVWEPPPDQEKITTIDLHTAGEPFRVIVSGAPEIPGDTILARRRWAQEHLEILRRALMWEPRGHADMYGGIMTPPVSTAADLGILFLHNDGYSTMCGHGIIALATLAVETGMVEVAEPETRIGIETPAGFIEAWVSVEGGRANRVRFRNVPSFAAALDQRVEVPDLGTVYYDLGYGGAFYAYVDAASVGLACDPRDIVRAIEFGRAIKNAIVASVEIRHPFEVDLGFLYGVVFTGPPAQSGSHSRNVCIFADGEVDRSPTGTSVSARLALHHARGELERGKRIVIESVIGTRFGGTVAETIRFGSYDAVIPEIDGSAFITGRHEFLIDPADPLSGGFLLR
jgi:proline racemase